MKQIGNIIAIEVPEDTIDCSVYYEDGYPPTLDLWRNKSNLPSETIPLPPGSYTFICTNRDATEEQKRQLCEASKLDFIEYTGDWEASFDLLLLALEADQGTKALLKKD
jgi:hypothetical protein